jgi:tetraacyldisaccharide 4'-kinase
MNFPGPVRILLWPASLLYGLHARIRAWLYSTGVFRQKHLKGKVISVGNLTVGGTGKTPTVIWLAEQFLAEGKSVAILTRGYRGTGETSDEIELMKQRLGDRVRFGVGPNRFRRGSALESITPVDVFILDDGYQHLQLARDVNILLIDSTRALRDEFLLPAGSLREPMSSLHRADIVFFTRSNHSQKVVQAIQESPELPIFPSETRLVRYRNLSSGLANKREVTGLPAQPIFAFCGIGNPDAFFADLGRWGNVVAGKLQFRDHHKYSAADIRMIEKQAKAAGARSIVSTEKDAINLGSFRAESLSLYLCEIKMHIPDAEAVLAEIHRRLAPRQVVSA